MISKFKSARAKKDCRSDMGIFSQQTSIVSLGERLRQVRNIFGMSQVAVAKAAGVSVTAWQNYENGNQCPGGKVLGALVQLGVNVNWILTGEGQMMRENNMLQTQSDSKIGSSEYEKEVGFITPNASPAPLHENIKLKVLDVIESLSEPDRWRAVALLLDFKESSRSAGHVTQSRSPLDPNICLEKCDMPFSVAVLDRFKNIGIKTLADLLAFSEEELLKCNRFGRKYLNDTKNVLHSYGLSLSSQRGENI